jgi:membrane fusion protein (multidrug efflux system)
MTTAHDKPEWAQSKREKENALRVANGQKPRRRIWPWVVVGLVAVGVVAMVMLQPKPVEPVAETVAEAQRAHQLLNSEIVKIAPSTLRATAKVTGDLIPASQSDVAAQASGRVLSVSVRPGDVVSVNQVLAEIDRETLELQLAQQRATANATRAQLLSAQQQLERTTELARQGLATPSTLDQSRSSVSALEANLSALESAVQGAELAVSKASLVSPVAGIVSSRQVEPGQTVQAGSPVISVVNLDKMELRAAASVHSSAQIAPGQPVAINVVGVDNKSFEGTVTRVNPVAVTGTRTVPVYISLDNPDGLLRGGMFATGQITVAEKPEAISVPATAIREDAEGKFVLKLVDGTLERQPIEIVSSWDRGRIVEVSGLNAGDTVVGAALGELSAGETYVVIED